MSFLSKYPRTTMLLGGAIIGLAITIVVTIVFSVFNRPADPAVDQGTRVGKSNVVETTLSDGTRCAVLLTGLDDPVAISCGWPS